MRRIVAAAVVCGIGLVLPAGGAAADGGPVPPMQSGPGATTPSSPVTFVAVGARGRTFVERIRRDGGAVEGVRALRGAYGVPGIAYDGSTTGLSADGRTLVLAALSSRYPQRRTRLAVLDARRLALRETIALRGFFTVDAISPDGGLLYLIHYLSARDTLRYEVRAYDLPAGRLLREPVIDPREPDEAMLGTPVTRAVSADGRWAYTLYQRPDGPLFVHALDTARRTAACVDLPLDASDLTSSPPRLTLAGGTLRVLLGGQPRALIDTRTFAVRRSGTARRHAPHAAAPPAGRDTPWGALVAAGLGALALALVGRRVRRRRRPSPGAASWGA